MLLATALIWGLNFPIAKGALRLIEPHVFNAVRFSFSALLLGVIEFVRFRRSHRSPRLTFGNALWVLSIGLIGHVLYQITFIEGLARTTAGSSALIMAATPIWTALVGLTMGTEQLGSRVWAGLSVAFLGTVLVVAAGAYVSLDPGATTGNLLIALASISWAAATVLSRPVLQRMSASRLTFYGMSIALPVLWLIALPQAAALDWQTVPLSVWGAMVYSGGLSTGLAYLLWNIGVQRLGASHSASFSNLVPLVGLVGGVVFLGEMLTLPKALGAILVIGGLVLMRFSRST